jgi:hypothetical protein
VPDHGLCRLAGLIGLDIAAWIQCQDGFAEDADLVAPWPVTEQIAAAATWTGLVTLAADS